MHGLAVHTAYSLRARVPSARVRSQRSRFTRADNDNSQVDFPRGRILDISENILRNREYFEVTCPLSFILFLFLLFYPIFFFILFTFYSLFFFFHNFTFHFLSFTNTDNTEEKLKILRDYLNETHYTIFASRRYLKATAMLTAISWQFDRKVIIAGIYSRISRNIPEMLAARTIGSDRDLQKRITVTPAESHLIRHPFLIGLPVLPSWLRNPFASALQYPSVCLFVRTFVRSFVHPAIVELGFSLVRHPITLKRLG